MTIKDEGFSQTRITQAGNEIQLWKLQIQDFDSTHSQFQIQSSKAETQQSTASSHLHNWIYFPNHEVNRIKSNPLTMFNNCSSFPISPTNVQRTLSYIKFPNISYSKMFKQLADVFINIISFYFT